jgi:hypothetical protein
VFYTNYPELMEIPFDEFGGPFFFFLLKRKGDKNFITQEMPRNL